MRVRVCSLLLLLLLLMTDLPSETEACMSVSEGRETNKGDTSGEKQGCKILIYNPFIGHYHMKFMSTIANELSDVGHEVTVLNSIANADLNKTKPALRKDVQEYNVGPDSTTAEIIRNGDTMDNGLRAFWNKTYTSSMVWGFFGHYWKSNNFSTMLTHQCKHVLNSSQFIQLKDSGIKFDLAITEVFDLCGLGLFNILKPARVVLASSIPLHDFFGEKLGLPKAFDMVPPKFGLDLPSNLQENFNTFGTRAIIQNAVESSLWGMNMFGWLEKEQTVLFKNNSDSFPGFDTLLRGAYSLMENVHPLLDLSKPTLNSIIPIGGITVDPMKELTDVELRERIDAAKGKRVLVSFGTVMDPKIMHNNTILNVLEALKNVKPKNVQFFWKMNRTLLGDAHVPDNIHIQEWLPQNDLLASGKINLFVSHMGIGSLSEASYSGVPMVSIPIFVDQPYNAICAIRLGIARFVDKITLSKGPRALQTAIEDALNNGTMRESSKKLSANLKNFGDQRRRMTEHINFVLTLPSGTSMAFSNHHHGVSVTLGFGSTIVHNALQYSAHLLCTATIFLVYCLLPVAYVEEEINRRSLPRRRILFVTSAIVSSILLYFFDLRSLSRWSDYKCPIVVVVSTFYIIILLPYLCYAFIMLVLFIFSCCQFIFSYILFVISLFKPLVSFFQSKLGGPPPPPPRPTSSESDESSKTNSSNDSKPNSSDSVESKSSNSTKPNTSESPKHNPSNGPTPNPTNDPQPDPPRFWFLPDCIPRSWRSAAVFSAVVCAYLGWAIFYCISCDVSNLCCRLL